MNFTEAAETHEAWKTKLSAYIDDPDGSLTWSAVADDTACDLGKWILARAAKCGGEKAYVELKGWHSMFHAAAADAIRMAGSGERASEAGLISSIDAFELASRKVVGLIVRMKALHSA
jgi:hypothetical protein